jgi:hypothetical protein
VGDAARRSLAARTLPSTGLIAGRSQDHKFAWQKGYAAFSVSASLIPTVVRYIQTRETHHRKMTFESELLALLKECVAPGALF